MQRGGRAVGVLRLPDGEEDAVRQPNTPKDHLRDQHVILSHISREIEADRSVDGFVAWNSTRAAGGNPTGAMRQALSRQLRLMERGGIIVCARSPSGTTLLVAVKSTQTEALQIDDVIRRFFRRRRLAIARKTYQKNIVQRRKEHAECRASARLRRAAIREHYEQNHPDLLAEIKSQIELERRERAAARIARNNKAFRESHREYCRAKKNASVSRKRLRKAQIELVYLGTKLGSLR